MCGSHRRAHPVLTLDLQAELLLDVLPAMTPSDGPLTITVPLTGVLKQQKAARAANTMAAAGGQLPSEAGSISIELRAVQQLPAPRTLPASASELAASAARYADSDGVAVVTSADMLAGCSVVHTPAGELYEAPPAQVGGLRCARAACTHPAGCL